MLKHIVLLGVLVLALTLNITGESVNPDEQAAQAIEAIYPYLGFVQKVKVAGVDGWVYEVGRVEFFGRRLVLGRGASWEAAFAELNESIKARVALPFGG